MVRVSILPFIGWFFGGQFYDNGHLGELVSEFSKPSSPTLLLVQQSSVASSVLSWVEPGGLVP